jgi:DASS family divalent anion:Na+ symporter
MAPGGLYARVFRVVRLTPDPPHRVAPKRQLARLLRILAVLAIGAIIWALPTPTGVDPRAWRLLAVFVATVAGIVVGPLPIGAVTVVSLGVIVVTGTLKVDEALSGFANPLVWLVLSVFFIASCVIKTGLGRRIVYGLISIVGRRTLGLGYSLVATDLVLSPAIPSTTARAGAIIFPLLQSLTSTAFGPPDSTAARQTSAFLTLTAFHGTVITSAMFVTAMAPNLLIVELARQQAITISWIMWAIAAVVPGVISLGVTPLLIYRLCPPGFREAPQAPALARGELALMGTMKREEWITIMVFLLLLGTWLFGQPALGIDNVAAALAALGVLLLTGVLDWKDVAGHREAWNTFVWFATLLMMATFLGQLGFTEWFSHEVKLVIGHTGWMVGFLTLSLIYFYSHYLFASVTAHVSAMYAPFLAVALALGTPPLLAALLLGFFSALFSSLTHYGIAPAPIFFGTGHVSLQTWWKVGAILGAMHIIVWLGVGSLWLKLLGYW